MNHILDIYTVDDLYRAIKQQRATTRTVTIELDFVMRSALPSRTAVDEEDLERFIMHGEGALLQHYAFLPTLLETRANLRLSDTMQTNATFGVVAIVGEVLLSNTREFAPMLVREHQTLLRMTLDLLNRDEDLDLVSFFLGHMAFDIEDAGLTPAEREKKLRAMLTAIADAIVGTIYQYDLLVDVDGCCATSELASGCSCTWWRRRRSSRRCRGPTGVCGKQSPQTLRVCRT